ncbi:MAG: nucleoside-diphosphate kinase [Candidatus Krumholzibacteria bacterium]|nr:nucleoside-diphosphate kinase [Candidatus Krumholzibacteria bacterium]MDH4338286.1 nucleoside-diphosphate kinase [Candidatus Krumholzibacteria bacterium]MDH5268919.1 nucleoside-diphosphate kinase [Candidatus Krumholzibacteria bacterium]
MKTLLMIKPDTVAEGRIGDIVAVVERNRFRINRMLMTRFSRERAERFYDMHRERPFFADLVGYITSGPVLAMEVEAEEAVSRIRDLIGATNPADARPGTIRAMYGKSLQNNAVHASDSPASAEKELEIAFSGA